jgi:hypothetical protein
MMLLFVSPADQLIKIETRPATNIAATNRPSARVVAGRTTTTLLISLKCSLGYGATRHSL